MDETDTMFAEPRTADAVGASATDLRMWVRLLACAKIVEKRLRRNFEEQFNTTLPRFDVMAALDRAPEGLNMGALSRALLVSNGNVTSIVRQLQAQRLVTSVPDPQDGRSAIVALTRKGRTYFTALAAAHHQWVAEALREFPVDRQEALLALLSDLKSSLSRTL
jgi:DNA-binding MarR family transcriptional regulator